MQNMLILVAISAYEHNMDFAMNVYKRSLYYGVKNLLNVIIKHSKLITRLVEASRVGLTGLGVGI